MAFECRVLEICVEPLCCGADPIPEDMTVIARLVTQSTGPLCDPDTGAVIDIRLPPIYEEDNTTGCLCTCELPVNRMDSDPSQAIPLTGTYYEVTVLRAGRVVLGPVKVQLDGDSTYSVGPFCGGVPICEVMIDVPPDGGSDAFCAAVEACETPWEGVAGAGVTITPGGTNGHAPTIDLDPAAVCDIIAATCPGVASVAYDAPTHTWTFTFDDATTADIVQPLVSADPDNVLTYGTDGAPFIDAATLCTVIADTCPGVASVEWDPLTHTWTFTFDDGTTADVLQPFISDDADNAITYGSDGGVWLDSGLVGAVTDNMDGTYTWTPENGDPTVTWNGADEVVHGNAPLAGPAPVGAQWGFDDTTGQPYYVDAAGQWVPVPCNCPSLGLVKQGSYDEGTGQVTYTFTVTNTGAVTLAGLEIDDPTIGAAAVAVVPATLAAGAQGTATVTYTPTAAQLAAGHLDNVATVSGTDPMGTAVANAAACTVSFPTAPAAAIQLVKQGEYDSSTGDITYTFTVVNTGQVTVDNLAVDDATIGVASLAVTPSTLAPGATGSCTATYTPTALELAAGYLANVAEATGTDPDGNTVTGVDGVAVTFATPSPGIQLVKQGAYDSGAGEVTYTFTVTNTGQVDLTGVNVDDPALGVTNLAVVPAALPVGAVGTATVVHAVTAAETTAGFINNVATATGTTPTGGLVSHSDGITTTLGTPLVPPTADAVDDAMGSHTAGTPFTYDVTANDTPCDTGTTSYRLQPGSAVGCVVVDLGGGQFQVTPTAAVYSFRYDLLCNGVVTDAATASGTAPAATAVAVDDPTGVHVHGVSYQWDAAPNDTPCNHGVTSWALVAGSETNCTVVHLGGGVFQITPTDTPYSFDYDLLCDGNIVDVATVSGTLLPATADAETDLLGENPDGVAFTFDLSANDTPCSYGTTTWTLVAGSEVNCTVTITAATGEATVTPTGTPYSFEYEIRCDGAVIDTAMALGTSPAAGVTADAVDDVIPPAGGANVVYLGDIDVATNDTPCSAGATTYELVAGSEVNCTVTFQGGSTFTVDAVTACNWSFNYHLLCDGVIVDTATVSGDAAVSEYYGPELISNGDMAIQAENVPAGTNVGGWIMDLQVGVFNDAIEPFPGVGGNFITGDMTPAPSNSAVSQVAFPGDPVYDIPATATFFYSNGSVPAGYDIMHQQFGPVTAGHDYLVLAYTSNAIAPGADFPDDPIITFIIDGVEVAHFTERDHSDAASGDGGVDLWHRHVFVYTPATSGMKTFLVHDDATGFVGDDLAITQVSIREIITC